MGIQGPASLAGVPSLEVKLCCVDAGGFIDIVAFVMLASLHYDAMPSLRRVIT